MTAPEILSRPVFGGLSVLGGDEATRRDVNFTAVAFLPNRFTGLNVTYESWSAGTGRGMAGYIRSPNALGSWMEWDLGALKPGNWIMFNGARRGANRAIGRWLLNGVQFKDDNQYAATAVSYDFSGQLPNITERKNNVLRVEVAGKDAASSDFIYGVYQVSLWNQAENYDVS